MGKDSSGVNLEVMSLLPDGMGCWSMFGCIWWFIAFRYFYGVVYFVVYYGVKYERNIYKRGAYA